MSEPAGIIIARVVAKTRDAINEQRCNGALSQAEATGARWATDHIEAMAALRTKAPRKRVRGVKV